MQAFDREALIADWISLYKDYRSGGKRDQFKWADKALNELCKRDPKKGLEVIRSIMARDKSDSIAEILAAGPLENLLYDHGDEVIDIIEDISKKDRLFRGLLGGVWTTSLPQHIRQRVDALIIEKW